MDGHNYATPISDLKDSHPYDDMNVAYEDNTTEMKQKAQRLNDQLNSMYQQELQTLQTMLEKPEMEQVQLDQPVDNAPPADKMKSLTDLSEKKDYLLILILCVFVFAPKFQTLILDRTPLAKFGWSTAIKAVIIVLLYHSIKKLLLQ